MYRWVKESEAISSPDEGTEEPVSRHSVAPSGAWSVRDTLIPAINRWAIFDVPVGLGQLTCCSEGMTKMHGHVWNSLNARRNSNLFLAQQDPD
jgi:hypothetical protein